jgi:integrase
MAGIGQDPRSFLKLPSKQRADLVQDFLNHESQRRTRYGRLSGSYLQGYLTAAESWLHFNGKSIGRTINIANTGIKTRTRDSKTPTAPQLAETLRQAGAHNSVRIVLIAHSGVRPEVLGWKSGADGLRIRDIPDLTVRKGIVAWERVPARINVRAELSKTRLAYFTFLGPMGCAVLKADLETRIAQGENLGPESPIVIGEVDNGRGFICTGNVTWPIKQAMRRAGLENEPPYVWRSYFSNRCLASQMTVAYREYMMGHSQGVAGLYSMGKEIPDDMVEKMRREYEKACQFLEPEGKPGETDPANEIAKMLLQVAGMSDAQIADMQLQERSQAELVELLRGIQKGAQQAAAKRTRQKIVASGEVESAIEAGYEYLAALPDGRVVVRLP